MSLHKKTFLFVTTVVAVALVGILVASRALLVEGYRDLEEKEAKKDISTLIFSIENAADNLDIFNSNQAARDDTYEFVSDVNQKYLDDNLLDSTFSSARINVMIFTDIEGNIVYEKAYDLEKGEEVGVPSGLREIVSRENLLLTHVGRDSISGLIGVEGAPMIISSNPILKSSREGPARGNLIMGRYIDEVMREKLAMITHFNFELQSLEDEDLLEKFEKGNEMIVFEPVSKKTLLGTFIIEDIYGNPALVGTVNFDRDIYDKGNTLLFYFVISTLLVGSIVVTGGIFYQDRVILSPVHKISDAVNKIRDSGDLSQRIEFEGKDEISQLANNINAMLTSLQEFKKASEDKEKQLAEKLKLIEKQNKDLEKTKQAMMNLLEDARELEENLRASQKNLEDAQRIANLGSWEWDIASDKLTWSDEVYRIFGLDKKDFEPTYESFIKYVHPNDAKKVEEAVQKSLKTKKPYSVEHRIILPDKTEKIIHERGEVVHDKNGKPIRMTGTVLDITGRKRLEELIKKEQERLELIINSMGEGLLVIDREYKLTEINPVAEKLLEVKATDAIGKKWSGVASTLKDHSETPVTERSFSLAVSEGKTIITRLDDDHYYKTKSGRVFPIISITAPLKSDGKIIGAVKVFKDATEEKKSKEVIEKKVEERTKELKQARDKISEGWLQVQQEKAKLTASINSLQLGFIIADSKNNIVVKNPAVSEILNIPDSEISLERIAAEMSSSVNLTALCSQCLKDKKTIERDDIIYKDKFLRVFLTPVVVGEEQSEVLGFVLLIEDITEQKQLERAKDEFFAVASHELRTPLTAIRGNTSLIQQYFSDKIDDPDLKEMIGDMHESSVRLINIVNDFLDASRLEQGKIQLKPEELNLVETVRGVVDELDEFAGQKGISIKVEDSKADIPSVISDKPRTQQIVHNLVGNAIKFSKDGEIRLNFEPIDGKVKVRVIDSGLGISTANRRLLFKKFQQAGERVLARDVTKGTGMGLYISKLLAEAMGGKVYLENSELGKGSTFAFELPVKK